MPEATAQRAALAEALCHVGRLFGDRQWCLATGGNFSARLGAEKILITKSGTDKSSLSYDDLMVCTLAGAPESPDQVPSAETALHACLYRHDSDIGAVLHTHSVTATVLSRTLPVDLVIDGFEMQKAIAGVRSHEQPTTLAVLDNHQDMHKLAALLAERLERNSLSVPGFLVRGHGLYAWGADIPAAQRHLEGLEFLLACLWQERVLRR